MYIAEFQVIRMNVFRKLPVCKKTAIDRRILWALIHRNHDHITNTDIPMNDFGLLVGLLVRYQAE